MAKIWTYEETRDIEYARCVLGDFRIEVQDLDGDISNWTVADDRGVVANGSVAAGNHFEAAKAAAWATVHSVESVPSGFFMSFHSKDQADGN